MDSCVCHTFECRASTNDADGVWVRRADDDATAYAATHAYAYAHALPGSHPDTVP